MSGSTVDLEELERTLGDKHLSDSWRPIVVELIARVRELSDVIAGYPDEFEAMRARA